jgi:hypothetical protein
VEEKLTSPPDQQDTGVSHTGAGLEDVGRSEPLVPPIQEKKKKKATASPSKTYATMPPPASRTAASDKAPTVSRQSPASGAMVTAEQLNAAVKAATTPAAMSQAQPQAQSLTLHIGRAVVVAGEKASAQFGRVVELTRDGASLGALQ